MRTLSAWFDATLTKRFLWISALAWYAIDTLLWIAAAIKTHTTAATVLNQSDSAYDSAIVESGYSGRNFAFFPLFPLIVRAILGHARTRGRAVQLIGLLLPLFSRRSSRSRRAGSTCPSSAGSFLARDSRG